MYDLFDGRDRRYPDKTAYFVSSMVESGRSNAVGLNTANQRELEAFDDVFEVVSSATRAFATTK